MVTDLGHFCVLTIDIISDCLLWNRLLCSRWSTLGARQFCAKTREIYLIFNIEIFQTVLFIVPNGIFTKLHRRRSSNLHAKGCKPPIDQTLVCELSLMAVKFRYQIGYKRIFI